jgi:RpiR family transcriptional regulator, carbohydrate utilization regulator
MNNIDMDKKSTTLQKISTIYTELPRVQQQIADFILNNPAKVVKCSISELSKLTEAKSEASVVKFYRTLGFTGYNDFKIQLAQELASNMFYHSYDDINFDDSASVIKMKVFQGAIATLNTNAQYDNTEAYVKACNLMLHAKRIILLGYATSAALCYYASFRFTELGFNCHFSSDSHINAAVLVRPNPDDLVFCVSHSGETSDLIKPLKNLAQPVLPIILVTGSHESTLSRLADVVLSTKSDETLLMTDAMNSRIAQLCTIDALFSMLSIQKGPEATSRLIATRRAFFEYKFDNR